jgi:hypothetical protein
MKTKKKKPTVKDISFRMQMLEELLEGLQKFMLEPLARSIDVLALTLNEYIEMKDDGDNLVNHLKDKAKNEKSKDSGTDKRKKKSTKGRGTPATISKNRKRV